MLDTQKKVLNTYDISLVIAFATPTNNAAPRAFCAKLGLKPESTNAHTGLHCLVQSYLCAFSPVFLCHGLSDKDMPTMSWDKNFFCICLIMAIKFCIYIKVLGYRF